MKQLIYTLVVLTLVLSGYLLNCALHDSDCVYADNTITIIKNNKHLYNDTDAYLDALEPHEEFLKQCY